MAEHVTGVEVDHGHFEREKIDKVRYYVGEGESIMHVRRREQKQRDIEEQEILAKRAKELEERQRKK
jgi:hypothetical protein